MANFLSNISTSLGDIVHTSLDHMLPPEMQFLSGAIGGVVDVATGNELSAAKGFIDAVLDLKDLQQHSSKPPVGQPGSPQANIKWQYEPPPPAPRKPAPVNVQTTPPPRQPSTGWRGTPRPQTPPPPTTWRGTPPVPTSPASSPPPRTTTPAATKPATTTAPATTTSPATTTTPTPSANTSKLSFADLQKLSNKDFMDAVASGRISDDVAKDPNAMMALQQRMNQITEMNQLMTSMLKAIHDMQMAIVQNVRV